MRGYFCLVNMLLLCMVQSFALAQTIQGQITDVNGGKPMANVKVQNMYTQEAVLSDADGKFSIEITKGQLVSFAQEGYKMLRVRIPQGNLPAFFKVVMERLKVHEEPAIAYGEEAYKADSAKYYSLYKKELEFQEITGLDVIRHPFSAMSKHNQQVWAFQKEYQFYQRQKYIDFLFNDQQITKVTGLKGDSLQVYKQIFRPTYEQLRAMGEYGFYSYIKRTATAYRKRGIRAKSSPARGTN